MKKLILALMLVPSMALADHNRWNPTPTVTTIDSTVTEQYYTSTSSTYENNFNDKEVSDAIAAIGAFSMIPTTNHRKADHGHWGVGVGVSSYNDSLGYALAVESQIAKQFNVKLGISGAGNEEVYGAGGMISF